MLRVCRIAIEVSRSNSLSGLSVLLGRWDVALLRVHNRHAESSQCFVIISSVGLWYENSKQFLKFKTCWTWAASLQPSALRRRSLREVPVERRIDCQRIGVESLGKHQSLVGQKRVWRRYTKGWRTKAHNRAIRKCHERLSLELNRNFIPDGCVWEKT